MARVYKYKFQLMAGRHVDSEGDEAAGEPMKRAFQAIPPRQGKDGVYPIINTDVDLSVFNGPHPSHLKFKKVEGGSSELSDPLKRIPGETVMAFRARLTQLAEAAARADVEVVATVRKMDETQLREFADTEGISIADMEDVEQIRGTIMAALE